MNDRRERRGGSRSRRGGGGRATLTPQDGARGRAIDALVAIDAGGHSQQVLSWALEGALEPAQPAGEARAHRDDRAETSSDEGRRLPLEAAERGLCTELVYGTLRQCRRIDAWLEAASDRGLVGVDVGTLAALRIGAHQLAGLDKIPDFAALNATVEAAKGRAPTADIGFVNAILRRLARESPWTTPAQTSPLVPWQERQLRAFAAAAGADADALVDGFTAAAPLHVHVTAGARADAAAQLAADGVEIARVGDLPGVYEVLSGPFFDSGLHRARAAIAQDAASAAITEWVGAGAGMRVADVCAGRGAKALFLAGAGASVDALDVDDRKLAAAAELAAFAGTPLASTAVADASTHLPLAPSSYDAVLVDAPCSGLGTLRRRPEIAGRRRMADVLRLAALQRAILMRAAALVRPGGVLVYAVCTFAGEEGEDVVDAFLASHPDFRRDIVAPAWLEGWRDARGDLRGHPLLHGADAFYAARLVRAA